MAAIVVEGLRKAYRDVQAVRDVSFEVGEGQVLALLGPNGAGKTTTVEILEGYRSRDAGRVSVLGVDPERGGRALRERVGIVPQEAGLYPELRVLEALRLHALYYPRPHAVDEVITMTGLEEKRDALIKTLSGGQKRRLDLALGIVGNPDLLFLEEPTTGFDPSARRQAWDVVGGLRGLGKTILLTTHYMDEAQHLADRVIVVAEGLVVASGTPEDLVGRDRDEAVVRFRLPRELAIEDLPAELWTVTSHDGDNLVVRTPRPTRALWLLTGWAAQAGVELDALTVERPTLEDTYLELVATQPEESHP